MKNTVQRVLAALGVMASIAAAWHLWLSPVEVETGLPSYETFSDGVFGTGTLEAKNRVSVSPRSTGQVIKLYADQGDEVKKDEPLVELFSDDVRLQLKIAEAELAGGRCESWRVHYGCCGQEGDMGVGLGG
jgi:multidrug efflux pump subunit AcrA (membrane-fusion protein)